MTKFIFLFALMGVVASCNLCNNQYTNQLKELDAQLEANPAMVWDSLKKIDPKQLTKPQQVYYYLLNVSATDKNLVYLENDSTLNIALEYYEEHSDPYNLGRSQYYEGKYLQKRGQLKEAYQLFKKAEINFKESRETNQHLLGLIYYQLGLIQKQQRNLVDAETLTQKSYNIFTEIRDTLAAIYALKLNATILIDLHHPQDAEKKLFEALDMISQTKKESVQKIEIEGNIYSALSLLHRKNKNMSQALEYGQKGLKTFKRNGKKIISEHYHNVLVAYNGLHQLDSAKYYCQLIIEEAQREDSEINLMNGYKILAHLEAKEGNYKEAYNLKNLYNKLKDSLSEVRNQNNIYELEKKYNIAESERLILKAEKSKWKAYTIAVIIILSLMIIGFPIYNRIRQLKLKYHRLSEAVKHTEWGFLVTKEFITENHIAYDELERMLNREKGLKNINSDLYNKFHEALIQQKADYSGRLIDRLTSFDGTFATKFQQFFPDLNTDELLMASMIHHGWKVTDMTTIFHSSLEAIRKRKARLAQKISQKLKKEVDLDEYLTNL